ASSLSALTPSFACSGSSAVTNTVATSKSFVTSTSDTLIDGSASSRTASCTIVPSRRRSSADRRSEREKERDGMLISGFLQSPCNLDTLVALDLVTRLDVVVLLDADAALHTVAHF